MNGSCLSVKGGFLALLNLVLVALAVLNFHQQPHSQFPDDGVSWVDSSQGITAWIVARDGPGERAGIREGDTLMAIAGKPLLDSAGAAAAVFRSGVWSELTYDLVREGRPLHLGLILTPQSDQDFVRYFLGLMGLLYLALAVVILLRRRRAPQSPHLYAFCLISFVLYTFSYTGKLNLFDWSIYWLNVLAFLAQPAVFLHFCLTLANRPNRSRSNNRLVLLLYLPAIVLLSFHLLIATRIVVPQTPLVTLRWMLDRVELVHLAAYFVVGAFFLQRVYHRTPEPKLVLKWVARGAWVAILPFGMLYALPYSLGFVPAPWMRLSTLSLILLPLSLSCAFLRPGFSRERSARRNPRTRASATRKVA